MIEITTARVRLEKAPPPHTSLSPNASKQVRELAEKLTIDPYRDPEAFASQARLLASFLPTAVKTSVATFARWGSSSGFLHFSGLPTGALPPTPEGNAGKKCGRTLGARCAAVLTSALGDLLGYEAEAEGVLLQDMAPHPQKATEQMSIGFATELELHVEQAHNPLRPDYVTLFCLRGDPNAKTYTLTAKVLAEHVTAAELAMLREPLWKIGVDPSFRAFTNEFDLGLVRGPGPILTGSPDDPLVIFDQDLQYGVTPRAQALLEKLIDIYLRRRVHVVLKPGDFLAIDNHRAVHGRSPYCPKFDGTDRWIARAFATSSLVRSGHARPNNGRVVAAQFC